MGRKTAPRPPEEPVSRPRKPTTTPATREPRVPVRTDAVKSFYVTLERTDTGERLVGSPVNLNTGGMFLRTDSPFPAETPVTLDACAHDTRTEYRFRLHGWVVYAVPDGMGIQFDEPTPEAVYMIHHVVRLFLPEGHHLADPSW
jgi:hypothetical protein